MTFHHLTYEECPRHHKQWENYIKAVKATGEDIRKLPREELICGCPRTTRTNGLLIYKQPITGNWVVWDVEGWTWLSLSGSWQKCRDTADLYIKHKRNNPGRGWTIGVIGSRRG